MCQGVSPMIGATTALEAGRLGPESGHLDFAHSTHLPFRARGVLPMTFSNAFSPVGSIGKVSRHAWKNGHSLP